MRETDQDGAKCSLCDSLCPRYVLDLPVPSWPHRAQLWQKLLPHKAPVARGVDYVQLAKW